MKFNLLIVLACCAALTAANPVAIQTCDEIVDMVPMGMWENIQACATSVVKAVLDLGSDLTESTNGAVQNVLKFKDLVLKCYNEPSKTAQLKCVVTNVREFKDCISQIFNDATEIVSVLKDQGTALINAIKSCHLKDEVTLFYEIVYNAEKCY